MEPIFAAYLAAVAVLADGFTTRAALKRGAKETNARRAWLTRKLGLDQGTVGVAIITAATLIAAFDPMVRWFRGAWGIDWPTVVSVYVFIGCYSAYAAFNNHRKAR